ncbi:MAG: cytidylate kinase family protein [Syntrophaceae bacterium]|nr:cytidylate kinase family protein [Syntrophaceae bacterium]
MAVLTIARKYGSGAREIGQAIAQQLKYDYIDRGRILNDMRAEGKQWEERAKYFDENYPDLWERYDWSFRGFVALNQSYFLNYALKDRAVIIGRGGNFLLKGIPFVLRVRIVAPIEKRIERVMEKEGVNSENARWLIEKADREMAGAIYFIYGRDWDNPAEYEMVFDTGVQTRDEIITAIKKGLLEKEKLNTPEARKILQLRALAAKIKAEIITDPRYSISALDVDPKEEGLVEKGLILRGTVHNQNDIKPIEETAKRLAGDVPVECELQYRWYSRLGPRQFK